MIKIKKEDIVIGQKVIPHSKTAEGWESELEEYIQRANSPSSQFLKKNGYLIVQKYDEDEAAFGLGDDNIGDENYDFFSHEDFELYTEKQILQQNKYKIYITSQQIEILNAVDRYMNKYPFAKEAGSEYISQSDDPQIGAVDLACELADIYMNNYGSN